MDEFEHAVLIAALDGAKDFEHQFDVFLAGGHDGLLSQAVKVPDEQYLAGTLDRSLNWKCELSEKGPFRRGSDGVSGAAREERVLWGVSLGDAGRCVADWKAVRLCVGATGRGEFSEGA